MTKMYSIKILFFFLLLSASSLANDMQFQQAQQLEKEGNYKEAMLLYKQIAQEKNQINRTKIEENIISVMPSIEQRQLSFIKNKINKSQDKETESTIEQVLSSSFDIYAYKDNYFLPVSFDTKKRANREQNEAKFQLSIKKPISYDFFGFKETLNFGYTQTSWWQIYSESSPFRETNYQPEIFALFPYEDAEKTALKAYKIAFLHESNGQSAQKSRSWNRLYLEGLFQLNELFITPRIWYRIPEESQNDDNSNIEHYLGYGDVKFFYAYKDHTFNALIRNNLNVNDNKGYGEFNWSFPFSKRKNTFAYLQLSTGYGESLIDYDKEVNRISFGISLSR